MSDVVDRLGAALLDASLAATAISGLVVLAMVQCRQPARRLGWARAGLLSTLALLPLALLNPVPRIDVGAHLRTLWPSDVDEPSSRPQGRARIEGGTPARTDATCASSVPRWPRWIARWLVLAYGVGATIGLGSVLLGACGSAWLVRRAWDPLNGFAGLL